METRQTKSNMKRQHENVDNERNKSQRLEPAAEPVSTKIKITDLNYFCLIKIFWYLDVQSLFNVANANKWLRPAAVDVHQRKFGETPVLIINFCQQTHIHSCVEQGKWDNKIRIFGLKTSLQYLRCFGPSSISDLTIDYNHSESKRNEYLHKYVNDYCATRLNRIKFLHMPNIAIEQFQKVFVNVQDLHIFYCELGQQLPTFIKCFPNVRRFEANSCSMTDRFIKKPFQHLKHLNFSRLRCDKFTINEIVADLLHGIDQLKSFKITYVDQNDDDPKMPISVLLNLVERNLSITKLWYTFIRCELIPVNSADVQRIVAENSALIELGLGDYLFGVNDALALIRQLNSLKKFKFQLKSSEYRDLVSQLDSKWEARTDHWSLIPATNEDYYRVVLIA